MIQIIFGLLLMVASIFSIAEGIKDQCNIKNYVLKTKVKDAFKDVNWAKQLFRTNDIILTDGEGHNTFYPSEEVDKAIKKLNESL